MAAGLRAVAARTIDPAQFDPLSTPPAQEVLARMRELCLALPDTRQELAFGGLAELKGVGGRGHYRPGGRSSQGTK